MARSVSQPGKAAGSDKLKIFISYSRREAAAANAIVDALRGRNIDAWIDTRGLPFGEKWQAELADQIRASDTVIWLVSESSIKSKWVNWELDKVKALNKRLVPVMVKLVNAAELPREIGEIQILPRDRTFDLARDIDTLVQVLETDHAWLKQATRWQDRATEWLAKGRTSAQLLSYGALTEAELWKDARPLKAPAPAQEVLDLMLASRREVTRRQTRALLVSVAVAVVATGLAGLAWWQSVEADRQRGVAVEQRRVTDVVRKEAQTTESGLLSRSSRSLTSMDTTTAMLLALEGMPDQTAQIDRPEIPETRLQLDRAVRSSVERAVFPHDEVVYNVAWSPDGRRLASVSKDGCLRLFDAQAFGSAVCYRLNSAARKVVFSDDGRYLASAGGDPLAAVGEVLLVDLSSKKEARLRHDRAVLSVSLSANGHYLATGSVDGSLSVYETQSLKSVLTATVGREVSAIAISHDSRFVAATYRDGVQMLDLENRAEPFDYKHDGRVVDVAFSRDGRLLATASWDRHARIFDVSSRKLLAKFPHGGGVWRLAFSPDGLYLATASSDGRARVFDITASSELRSLHHDQPVTSVAFHQDGRHFLTASQDGTARLYQMKEFEEVARLSHGSKVHAAAINPVTLMVATAADDGTARLFNVPGGEIMFQYPHKDQVLKVVADATGSVVASLSDDRMVSLFSDQNGRIDLPVRKGKMIKDIALSPDGRLLAVAAEATVDLFDARSGVHVRQIRAGGRGVDRVLFGMDQRLAVVADRMVEVFSTKVRQPATGRSEQKQTKANDIDDEFLFLQDLLHPLPLWSYDHLSPVTTVSFSNDGKMFASGAADGTLKLIDTSVRDGIVNLRFNAPLRSAMFINGGTNLVVACGAKVHIINVGSRELALTLDFEREIDDVLVDATGRYIAVVSDNSIQLRSMSDEPILEIRHRQSVRSMTFSSDGRLFASASQDNSVRVHDLDRRSQIATLEAGVVNSVSFLGDSHRLVTGSSDRNVVAWRMFPKAQDLVDATKSKAPRCLTQSQRQEYFLTAAPPIWCVERRLWPYHSAEWYDKWLPKQKAWLKSGRRDDPPSLPKLK